MRDIEKNEKMFNVIIKTRAIDQPLTAFRKETPEVLGRWIQDEALAPSNQETSDDFGLWLEVNLYGACSNNATQRSFAKKEPHSDEYTLKLRPLSREACVELTEGGRVRLHGWEHTDRTGKRQVLDLTLHPKDGSAHVKSVCRYQACPRKEGKRHVEASDSSRQRLAV